LLVSHVIELIMRTCSVKDRKFAEIAPRENPVRLNCTLTACAALCLSPVFLMPALAAEDRSNREDEGDDAALARQFLEEGPRSWHDYAERVKHLQGTISFVVTQNLYDIRGQSTSEFKTNRNAKLVWKIRKEAQKGQQDDDEEEVYAINARYAFSLHRRFGARNWIVSNLIDLTHAYPPPDLEEQFKRFHTDAVSNVLWILQDPLSDLVRRPSFRVVHCRKLPAGDEILAEVRFECPHKLDDKHLYVQAGTMMLDPKHLWILRSYSAQTNCPGVRGSVKFHVDELSEAAPALAVPRQAVRQTHFVFDDGRHNRQVWRFENDLNVRPRLPDDAEFALSAFGLPEPAGIASPGRSVPLFVWVGVAAIACIALGLALRIRRSRSVATARA